MTVVKLSTTDVFVHTLFLSGKFTGYYVEERVEMARDGNQIRINRVPWKVISPKHGIWHMGIMFSHVHENDQDDKIIFPENFMADAFTINLDDSKVADLEKLFAEVDDTLIHDKTGIVIPTGNQLI